jgi:hypothetical protein
LVDLIPVSRQEAELERELKMALNRGARGEPLDHVVAIKDEAQAGPSKEVSQHKSNMGLPGTDGKSQKQGGGAGGKKKKRRKKKKKKFRLPHACRHLGYVLSLVWCGSCIFTIILYGLMFDLNDTELAQAARRAGRFFFSCFQVSSVFQHCLRAICSG